MTSIGSDDQIGDDRMNDSVFFEFDSVAAAGCCQACDSSTHANTERVERAGTINDEFQKLTLRHHRDIGETAAGVSKIDDLLSHAVGGEPQRLHFRVWQFQQFFGKSHFVQEFHDSRMNRVAAKVAIEIVVSFQQQHADALLSQQVGRNDSRGPRADDAACGVEVGISHGVRAVYLLLWTVLARGSRLSSIETRAPRPQLSVIRCSLLQISVVYMNVP
jgi:hypothetical protein